MSRVNWSRSALLVDVEALTYVYRSRRNELVALRDHQLQVATGEKVVVGPFRSGKTTLLKILACLERPDTGAEPAAPPTLWIPRDSGRRLELHARHGPSIIGELPDEDAGPFDRCPSWSCAPAPPPASLHTRHR